MNIDHERAAFEKREEEHQKKVQGYVTQVKKMVRETGIIKEIDDPEEKETYERQRKKRCKLRN